MPSSDPRSGRAFGHRAAVIAVASLGVLALATMPRAGHAGSARATDQSLVVSVSGEGSVTGAGIDCPGTCSAMVKDGAVVVLSAAAAPGWQFEGWGGACTGTGECKLAMTTGRKVEASFSQEPPPAGPQSLTVTVSGPGSVAGPSIACPTTCSGNFAAGTAISLVATPDTGASFAGWAGDCSGTGACSLTMNIGHSVTATFSDQPQVLQLRTELELLTTPVAAALLGPEHGQPVASTGPLPPTKGPATARLPHVRISAPATKIQAGALVHVSLAATGPVPASGIAWDLDGDGQRNDAYGTRIAFPVTCPGRDTIRAEIIDSEGARVGDAATLLVSGDSRPAGLAHAIQHAPTVHGPLEFGSAYGGWRPVGSAFGIRPQHVGSVPIERTLRTAGSVGGDYASVRSSIGAVGRDWATSWRAAPGIHGLTLDAAGETATGALVSPRFVLRNRFVTFRLGGRPATCAGKPAETATLYVLRHGSFRPVPGSTLAPGDHENLQPVAVTVPRVDQGAAAVLVLDDGSAAGHLNVDALANPQNIPSHRPLPVAGWADTHEHLDAHQGFGGLDGVRTYMGVPGSAYDNYEPPLSSTATPAQRSAYERAYATDMRDSSTHFAGPIGSLIMSVAHSQLQSTSIFQPLLPMVHAFHEQFHVTELHRDWEGGMRLISSLAISNASMQYLMSAPQNQAGNVALTPTREVIEANVIAMRQLAAANRGWMQIVYSPTQAHDVISEGKLAVVLGTEVDELGTLGFTTPETEVDWLWRLGIRQVTPVHAIDNKIGGTAIFQDVYDMTNDLVNRHNPAGNSTTQSSTDQVVNGIAANGIEASADSNGRTFTNRNASFGFFLHTTNSNECDTRDTAVVGYGNCVDFFLSPAQLLIGLGTLNFPLNLGRTPEVVSVHPANSPGGLPPPLADATTLDGPPSGGTNVTGLTAYGLRYIDALERHGMLVDLEHMSDASVADLLAPSPSGAPAANRSPAWQFDPNGGCQGFGAGTRTAAGRPITESICYAKAYPFMSSHTSFRSQSLTYAQTGQKGFVRREFERTNAQIDYIDRAGGTIAPVVLQDPVNAHESGRPAGRHTSATDPERPSLNDCAGSSKSWVEAYLWAYNHTINHRIALSTDMAVVGGTGARFTLPFDPTHPALPGNCPASSANAFAGLNFSLDNIVRYLRDPQAITQDLIAGEQQEERKDPSQYNHSGQTDQVLYTYNPITGAALHPDQPPVGPARNFNFQGLVTIGQLPDLLQDSRNDGLVESDLAPLLNSAESYIEMWNKAFQLNGCLDANDNPTPADGPRCQGAPPTNAGLDIRAICRNTCPDDPGDGSSLDPAGRVLQYPAIAIPAG